MRREFFVHFADFQQNYQKKGSEQRNERNPEKNARNIDSYREEARKDRIRQKVLNLLILK